jgi:hypothetical protein
MTLSLPELPELEQISHRLPLIFPEGLDNRNYFVRAMAAKAIFVMFYVGAVEGYDRWLRPNQVARMTDEQARRTSPADRIAWTLQSLARRGDISGRWFADTTREPIRDETIRNALVRVGAVIEREGVPITSSKGRYALAADFARLFLVPDEDLDREVNGWAENHLTTPMLARMEILRSGVAGKAAAAGVLVRFPNGETRRMSSGPSSEIARSVIEEFAPRFLEEPGVIWLSESRKKVVARDEELAHRVGLNIEAQRVLPDVILVDVGSPNPVLVFVEVVASDGPVTERRKQDLVALLEAGGHSARHAAFVTAYRDRGQAAYRRTGPAMAWGSFAWFASEPDRLIVLCSGEKGPAPLSRFLGLI